MMKAVPNYLFVEWIDANPNTEIVSEEQVSNYYTYAGDKTTLKANAYRKIIFSQIAEKLEKISV